jgi:cellulose synthase/poly-beta-1,6-N-acetylglucosamine synthase-like glycosyltransferase
MLELWRAVRRNSIDFKSIPHELLEPMPSYYKNARSLSQKARKRKPEHHNYPVIAALVCTYNEPPAMVKATVKAILAVDYPSTCLDVYVLDDGKRDEMREMTNKLIRTHKNLRYQTRPDNSHAKAGNLNYTLERSHSDLFIVLDADFVVRPNLVQRLLPYFYNYNERLRKYQFNESLACVQTPQQFRNLSPYDHDPLDQRSTMFFCLNQLAKDWFNASTLVGTTNLLARRPAHDVGYFPPSVTEDSAMSIMLHSKGYRTYYVNEPLAHGLACTTLSSNVGQRTRWMRGDFQILFSKVYSPLVRPGLSLMQRILYLCMAYNRFTSIINLSYEVSIVLLLTLSISPLDVPDPKVFFIYLGAYLIMDIVKKLVLNTGRSRGLHKSEAGSSMLETLLRFKAIRGFVVAIIGSGNVKFNVTAKSLDGSSIDSGESSATLVPDDADILPSTPLLIAKDDSDDPPRQVAFSQSTRVVDGPSPPSPSAPKHTAVDVEVNPNSDEAVADMFEESQKRLSDGASSDGRRSSVSTSGRWSSASGRRSTTMGTAAAAAVAASKPQRVRGARRREFVRSLRQIWFSTLCAAVLIFAIVWGILYPPRTKTGDGEYNNARTLSILGFGFAGAALLIHLGVMSLAFMPYTKGWMLDDWVHGSCDQYARRANGKKYVPLSWVSLLSVAKSLILIGFFAWLGYLTWTVDLTKTVIKT